MVVPYYPETKPDRGGLMRVDRSVDKTAATAGTGVGGRIRFRWPYVLSKNILDVIYIAGSRNGSYVNEFSTESEEIRRFLQ